MCGSAASASCSRSPDSSRKRPKRRGASSRSHPRPARRRRQNLFAGRKQLLDDSSFDDRAGYDTIESTEPIGDHGKADVLIEHFFVGGFNIVVPFYADMSGFVELGLNNRIVEYESELGSCNLPRSCLLYTSDAADE